MAIPDKKKSSYLQELERRANDTLIVYNPLDEDVVVEWDRRGGVKLFRVAAKTEVPLIRYIAEKYIKEMYTKIINKKAADAIKKENERRIKSGMAIMDKTLKTGEQEVFESKFYNAGDDEAKKIISILYVGVEREYGVDRGTPSTGEIDDRPSFDKAMESVQDEKDTGTPVSTEEAPQKKPSEAQSEFKCDWPDCDVTSTTKAGIMSHKRSHRSEMDNLEGKKEAAVAAVAK